MAFPVGAVLGGIGFLGDLIGGIKQRKENERLRREQQKQLQSQQAIAAAGRFDQDQGGGAGPTAGLSLRPQSSSLIRRRCFRCSSLVSSNRLHQRPRMEVIFLHSS
jgi:hypothetical protein